MTNSIYTFVTLAYTIRQMFSYILQLLLKILKENLILLVPIVSGRFHTKPNI